MRISILSDHETPTLVWSDGKWEADDEVEPAGVGFVVAWPRERFRRFASPPRSAAEFDARYVLEHARAEVSAAFLADFAERQTYIGQIEILAGLCVYTSLGSAERPRGRSIVGRRVLHFIDNTSALAGMARGYAGPTDSRRLVHALHCLLAGYGTAAWFDYVPSKANVSDEPSREPALAHELFVIDEDTGLSSLPVPFFMPAAEAWASDAGDWFVAAAEALD